MPFDLAIQSFYVPMRMPPNTLWDKLLHAIPKEQTALVGSYGLTSLLNLEATPRLYESQHLVINFGKRS
jgi:hypothetical protein